MTELPAFVVRLIATGVAAMLGFVAPAPAPVDVPTVRTAAERADSGGERVRRIAAPPRRAAVQPGSGSLGRVQDRVQETDERTPGRDAGRQAGGSGSGAGRGAGRAATAGDGVTAAATQGWGAPVREDDFDGGLGRGWGLYDGAGHAGNGTRSPGAITVENGVLVITGTPDGTTGGMAWNPGQMYGRWEGRVRSPASDPSYHSLLLLWPDAEDWPVGGEVDFMEISDASRQTVELFLHYGADNSQIQGDIDIDATEWHNWAVEWTPDHIAAFVDGEEWWRTEDKGTLPPGPMHLTIQLDWFPEGGNVQESRMEVDWVRQYEL